MAETGDDERRSEGRAMARQSARMNAPMTLIAGLVLLYYGWGSGWVFPANRGAFYLGTLHALDWVFRFGGIGLLVASIMCFTGLRVGLILDSILSGLCGFFLLGGALVLMSNDGLGMTNVLFAALAIVLGSSARSCWAELRLTKTESAGHGDAVGGWFGRWSGKTAKAPIAPPAPEPIHPASIRPSVLPKEGEPPPPEGYLAALAREKDEPPRASYE